MSIRTVACPGCATAVNIAATMTNVRCPSCATVWNVNHPEAAQVAAVPAPAAEAEPETDDESGEINEYNLAVIAGVVGTGMFLLAMLGLVMVMISRQPEPKPDLGTIKPAVPEEYRVVNLPDEQRRRIYDDYRKVARTTVEKPLALPQGTQIRENLEVMLDKTYERELMRFAALHDIEVADVREIIKEGDAEKWDTRARSNAVRDGKRVYTEEMSEGWDPKNN